MADLGNSRLKWARVVAPGHLAERVALPLDPASLGGGVVAVGVLWPANHRGGRSRRSILQSRPSSPSFCKPNTIAGATWFQAAAEVPVPMDVEGAETGGADRALGVLAALRAHAAGPARPGRFLRNRHHRGTRHQRRGYGKGVRSPRGSDAMASALHIRDSSGPLDRCASIRRRITRHRPGVAGTVASLQPVSSGEPSGSSANFGSSGRRPRWRSLGCLGGRRCRILAPYVSGDDARIEPDLVLVGLSLMVVRENHRAQ